MVKILVCRLLMAVALVIAIAAPAVAQQASITGTVADSTDLPLPGVTVVVTNGDTGVPMTVVSDARGEYRVPRLSPGRYTIRAELSGFNTVVLEGIELLVGQSATIPVRLDVAQLNETLVVTGEAPLVDTTSSQVSGNVDRRQMEDLPLQGRNWIELSKMVKGITANTITNTPGVAPTAPPAWKTVLALHEAGVRLVAGRPGAGE